MRTPSILHFISRRIFFIALAILFAFSIAHAQHLDMNKLKGFQPRNIGPAGMSGRVAAVAVARTDPDIIYVGAASGGLWKSTSGGIAWEPVFDDQPAPSIGAIAIDPHNADVVWAGTGEGNPRNSAAVGNGIFKSLDGCKTWQFSGLEKTERIHRILINPQNTDIVYAAAMGTAWGENPERGVFKTTDGGKTWQRVLFVDEKTGAADLVINPQNPNKLIAAMWQFRRWPWFMKSGGPGSGIFVTYDGGQNWQKRTHEDGLPKGDLGRTGLAIARNNPQVVYALVEAKKSALFRSDDGGFKWRKINDSDNVNPRPFYYADLRIDPKNENRVYAIHSRATVSEDGGKTFRTLVQSSKIHGDVHELYIHPDNPNFIINGNDGGIGISRDMGKTWRFVENLPFAQFYHIAVDMEKPYNVYGGLQDNGSWRGPSRVLTSRNEILNLYWARLGGGDGFAVLPDLGNPARYGYAMSQGGNLYRFDLLTGERKNIKPAHPQGLFLRFNWNSAIAQDPFDDNTLYYGSQFVHKSADRGDSWEIISPDLTTNDPKKQNQIESGGLSYDATGAENHTTIMTIAPSPVQQGVIWVGTDDGNVQFTRDGGANWTNVVKNIKGVPAGAWVAHIEASKFDPAEAFVVFDDHRRSNWTTYVYRTTNYGKSWSSLATDDLTGFVHVIEQDLVERSLLFAGTEFGLHVSIDGGKSWKKWTQGFPTAPVRSLVVHPREHDLVIGTHGRAAWIIDDIRPLRALARDGQNLLEKPLHLFDIADATQYILKEPNGLRGPGDAEFFGDNRPYGAMISFVANPPSTPKAATNGADKKAEKATIEIVDAEGKVIRTLKEKIEPGLNRSYWELRKKAFRRPSRQAQRDNEQERSGHFVLPGAYMVRISFAGHKDSTSVNVLPDPRKEIAMVTMREKYALIEQVGGQTELLAEAIDRLRDTKESIDMVLKRLQEHKSDKASTLKKSSKAIQDSIKVLMDSILGKEVQGIRRDPNLAGSRLRSVLFSLQSSWDAPTQMDRINMKFAEEKLADDLEKINVFYATVFSEYQKSVDSAGIALFNEYLPLDLK